MAAAVKGLRKTKPRVAIEARTRRSVASEARILDAASDLFVARGWRGTTLAEVACAADVGARTVYVRFGTKATLFARVMDVAVVGDTDRVALADRDWVVYAMSAPTLVERIGMLSDGAAQLFARLGPLMPALREAEVDDPELAARAQGAREDTVRHNAAFWTGAAADQLIHPAIDLDWVIATSSLLGTADTYLLMMQTLRWTGAQYRDWRRETWTYFATAPKAPRRTPTAQ